MGTGQLHGSKHERLWTRAQTHFIGCLVLCQARALVTPLLASETAARGSLWSPAMSVSVDSVELVEELHRRQGVMYAGGPLQPVLDLLDPAIVWHVPGSSPIAGEHHGRDAVAAYFTRRRELASATMRMHPGPTITDQDVVVQIVDGTATLSGGQVRWRTVGIYHTEAALIGEVWLVPLDLDQFDRIWTPSGSKQP